MNDNETKVGSSNSPYSRDGDNIYYSAFAGSLTQPQRIKYRLKQAHAPTFQYLDKTTWAKDANHVYLDGFIMPELDPATVELIPGTKYVKDANGVYKENIQPDITRWLIKLEDKDPKTFPTN